MSGYSERTNCPKCKTEDSLEASYDRCQEDALCLECGYTVHTETKEFRSTLDEVNAERIEYDMKPTPSLKEWVEFEQTEQHQTDQCQPDQCQPDQHTEEYKDFVVHVNDPASEYEFADIRTVLSDPEIRYIRFQARCDRGYDVRDNDAEKLMAYTAHFVVLKIIKQLKGGKKWESL